MLQLWMHQRGWRWKEDRWVRTTENGYLSIDPKCIAQALTYPPHAFAAIIEGSEIELRDGLREHRAVQSLAAIAHARA